MLYPVNTIYIHDPQERSAAPVPRDRLICCVAINCMHLKLPLSLGAAMANLSLMASAAPRVSSTSTAALKAMPRRRGLRAVPKGAGAAAGLLGAARALCHKVGAHGVGQRLVAGLREKGRVKPGHGARLG
jgi:hypothetical protein